MALSTESSTAAATASSKAAARSVMTKLGTGSGVDTATLAESLVEAEKAPRKNILDAAITRGENRIAGYSAMLLNLDNIRTAFRALDDPADVNTLQSSSSSTAVGVSAGANATAGAHSVEVLQLARPQKRVSAGFAAADARLNGGQEFYLRLAVNGSNQNVRVTGANATPQGMVNAINNAKLGVNAQLVNTNDGTANPFKIVLTGTEGAQNGFSISTDDGSGTAEVQTLTLGAAARAGSITVGGVSVAVTAGDTAAIVAGKVKAALDADSDKKGLGRTISQTGGQLTINFSKFEGDVPALSFADGSNTGVTGSSNVTQAYVAGAAVASVPERQKVVFTAPTGAGQITVAGTAVTLDGTETALQVAEKVRDALITAQAAMNPNPGRSYAVDTSDNSLLVTYTAADADAAPITVVDGDGLGGNTSGASGTVSTTRAFTSRPAVDFGTSIQSAADARLNVNGLELRRSSNTVTDAIGGVTLTLSSLSNGTPATLNVTRDTAALKTKIEGLVKTFNDAMSDFGILSGPKNAKDETDIYSGSLQNDSTVNSVRSQLRSMFLGNSTSPGGSVRALRDLGVSITKEGVLEFDEKKFNSTVDTNFSEVVTALTADRSNKSDFGNQPRGIAGEAVKRLNDMMKSTGLLATQTNSTQKQIDRYKLDLERLELRMKQLLTRYQQSFAVMDSIVSQSSATQARLKAQFTPQNNN
jgi:flagellar hook-associated protein 2